MPSLLEASRLVSVNWNTPAPAASAGQGVDQGTEPGRQATPLRADTATQVIALSAGRGRDTFTSEDRGYAIADANLARAETGQQIDYSIAKINSVSSLRRNLGLTASASFSGLFGNASAKAGFFEQHSTNSYQLYLLIRCRVSNGRKVLRPFALNDDARKLASARPFELAAFHRRYGDRFVSGGTTGGEFYALYEFETQSASDRSELSAHLDAAVGSFKGAADLQAKLQSIHTSASIKMYFHAEGGQPDKLPELKPETLIDFASAFPATVRDGSGEVNIETELTDYSVAEGFPSEIETPYRSNRIVMNHLADLYDEIGEYRSNIDYVSHHTNQFEHAEAVGQKQPSLGGQTIAERLDVLKGDAETMAEQIALTPYEVHQQSFEELRNSLNQIKSLLPEEMEEAMTGIQCGYDAAGQDLTPGEWNLREGQGERHTERTIKFAKPFLRTPQVQVALHGLDAVHYPGGNHRLVVEAVNVNNEGFTLRYRTWSDTSVFSAWVSWMALPA